MLSDLLRVTQLGILRDDCNSGMLTPGQCALSELIPTFLGSANISMVVDILHRALRIGRSQKENQAETKMLTLSFTHWTGAW